MKKERETERTKKKESFRVDKTIRQKQFTLCKLEIFMCVYLVWLTIITERYLNVPLVVHT